MRLRPRRGRDGDHRVGDRGRAPDSRPGYLRLDRALGPGRNGRLAARGRRRGFHRPAQAPGNTEPRVAFRVEVRVSGEFEVQVTEELEVVQATSEAVRIEHSSPDRARAREVFERLAG